MPEAQRNDPLRGFRSMQQRFDTSVSVMLEQAARDIRTRVAALPRTPSGTVRAAQLNAVLAQISVLNERVWNSSLLDEILAGNGQAMQLAQKSMETLNRFLLGNLPSDIAQAVSDSLSATAQAGIRSAVARVPRALSDSVWNNSQLANGKIESLIRSGLVAGLSARELSQTVYRFASPTTPGGQSYAAMRLARTEINNAFHEQQKAQGSQIGVLGTKWNLSGSHPENDECDDYANHRDSDVARRLGALAKGVFPPGEVPNKPHPHCFCFLSYVTMTPREFSDAMMSGLFDDELDRRTRALVRSQLGG
jgi:hypothetical protein